MKKTITNSCEDVGGASVFSRNRELLRSSPETTSMNNCFQFFEQFYITQTPRNVRGTSPIIGNSHYDAGYMCKQRYNQKGTDEYDVVQSGGKKLERIVRSIITRQDEGQEKRLLRHMDSCTKRYPVNIVGTLVFQRVLAPTIFSKSMRTQ